MSYEKHTWQTGEIIAADKLNNIENGIASIEGNITTITNNVNTLQNHMISNLVDGSATGSLRSIGAIEENSDSSSENYYVLGSNAIALGYQAKASGIRSIAEGFQTTASGSNSHAEGFGTITSESASHAEGNWTTASGINSHAEGSSTIASGINSHTEGSLTKASGASSHAEGFQTTASGQYSHVEGFWTKASEKYSHAEGQWTVASSTASHAEGYQTTASGQYSHAGGYQTIAASSYQTVIGKSNKEDSNQKYVFIIGNGNKGYPGELGTTGPKLDAFRIGWDGNIQFTCGSNANYEGFSVASDTDSNLWSALGNVGIRQNCIVESNGTVHTLDLKLILTEICNKIKNL